MTTEQRLDKLERELELLKASATIPYHTGEAIKTYLGIESIPILTTSSKGANTEDVSINEAGASTHTVLADPAGFLQVTIANTVYYLPYFSS